MFHLPEELVLDNSDCKGESGPKAGVVLESESVHGRIVLRRQSVGHLR